MSSARRLAEPAPNGSFSRARRAWLQVALCAPFAAWSAPDERDLWKSLRAGGHVLLIRHAATEAGLGDPPGFQMGDCATQRNLSDAGREDARQLGERIRRERVPIAQVFTSPWCRCRDTATMAFGRAEDWEALSSFFDVPHREAEYAERMLRRISGYAKRKPQGNVVMVTHNVNIAALTKLSVATGEVVVVRPDGCCGLKVVGRLQSSLPSSQRS